MTQTNSDTLLPWHRFNNNDDNDDVDDDGICKAPTSRLRAVSKQNILHIRYIETENVWHDND